MPINKDNPRRANAEGCRNPHPPKEGTLVSTISDTGAAIAAALGASPPIGIGDTVEWRTNQGFPCSGVVLSTGTTYARVRRGGLVDESVELSRLATVTPCSECSPWCEFRGRGHPEADGRHDAQHWCWSAEFLIQPNLARPALEDAQFELGASALRRADGITAVSLHVSHADIDLGIELLPDEARLLARRLVALADLVAGS